MISAKVTNATIASAVGAILLWLLQTYAHVTVPEGVQMAAVTILTLIVGYVTEETRPAPSAEATLRRRQARPADARWGARSEP